MLQFMGLQRVGHDLVAEHQEEMKESRHKMLSTNEFIYMK